MKNRSYFGCIAVIIMILCSGGCSGNSPSSIKEGAFSELNKNITLSGYFKITVLNIGNGQSTLIYENISSEEIKIMLPDQHKIFLYDETLKQWVTISDLMHTIYPQLDEAKEFILLGTKQDYENGGDPNYYTFVIKPDAIQLTKPVSIRVLLVGELIENMEQPATEVGGFVDILIED